MMFFYLHIPKAWLYQLAITVTKQTILKLSFSFRLPNIHLLFLLNLKVAWVVPLVWERLG